MRRTVWMSVLAASVAVLLMIPQAALAAAAPPFDRFTYTSNMHPLGFSERENTEVPFTANSDLAFWGKTAYQGNYDGFRIIDITEPDNPVELNDYRQCAGDQGDVLVWRNLLVRSWNSPASPTATCDGKLVGSGFEGLHIFDVSDPADPHLVGSVPLKATLPNKVTVDPPSPAAGEYQASGAAFGPPPPDQGISGDIVLVNDGVGTTTDGCEPFSLPSGAVALVDRGTCTFVQKVHNAQNAGASAVIVANNVPGQPITMGGTDPTITIPSVMVSLEDGTTIKGGLPATGTVAHDPTVPPGNCGSHTATLVPDVAHGRLLVYNSASDGNCPGIDIVQIPLNDPGSASFLHRVPAGRPCHDTGVILGDVLKAACAGGNGFTIFSMDPADGGSLDTPVALYSKQVPGVTIGHSAAFTWDGKVIVFGHEPGGGSQARCQPTSSDVDKTLFFFDTKTGAPLGEFVNPRPQTATENCTWHNYNVVPTANRYVLVAAQYQGGISVVDFTDPANAKEIAYADPAPLSDTQLILGGDWSDYWYNGRIYESDITRGLLTWRLSDQAVAQARQLGHLNPQTQEFTIG